MGALSTSVLSHLFCVCGGHNNHGILESAVEELPRRCTRRYWELWFLSPKTLLRGLCRPLCSTTCRSPTTQVESVCRNSSLRVHRWNLQLGVTPKMMHRSSSHLQSRAKVRRVLPKHSGELWLGRAPVCLDFRQESRFLLALRGHRHLVRFQRWCNTILSCIGGSVFFFCLRSGRSYVASIFRNNDPQIWNPDLL